MNPLLHICSPAIRSRRNRLNMFGPFCSTIGSLLQKNAESPALGGNDAKSASSLRKHRLAAETKTASVLRGYEAPVEEVQRVIIFRRAEGSSDYNRGDGDPGFAGHNVSRRSSGPTQRSGPHFRKNAQTFHSHCARRQGFGRTLALRLDEGANYLSRAITKKQLRRRGYADFAATVKRGGLAPAAPSFVVGGRRRGRTLASCGKAMQQAQPAPQFRLK
jgi:hypothetical protein